MVRHRIYYHFVKPIVPRTSRLRARSAWARRQRWRHADRWPIDPAAGRPPPNWPGWPQGKRFALVLTHDVEGAVGLAKCRQLMELERQCGVRSSFNFVPEGDYRVPDDLRAELTGHGFEIGIHDLHHDGKLYDRRDSFRAKADRINQYLADWGAVGFRSAFMLHRLDWLHDLKIRYDASTFDTDPFEPQPQGRRTIFPFWVPRDDGGYVELPYTLPQDSTLFLILGQTSPEIWQRKLDWIAEHGGMALVNVHPDYMTMPGARPDRHEFPNDYYRQFIAYVQTRYDGQFWHALPRDVAAFVAPLRLREQPPPRRIAMVCYSNYATDGRVTRYAESLAARGDEVDVVALQPPADQPAAALPPRIRVRGLQTRTDKSSRALAAYLLPLLGFLAKAAVWLARQHHRRPYDLIHIHNMPDFLVLAAWFPRLTGARVILDIHDIVPELFASKFGSAANGRKVQLLRWVERRCARLADHIIISNHLWRDLYAQRTGTADRCSVFINHVDQRVFQPRPRTRTDDKPILLFPGGLQWHQGLDLAVAAMPRVRAEFPNAELHIYGDGIMKPRLIEQAQQLGLNGAVRFFPPRPLREIAGVMAEADLGIVPKRADSFGNEAYSTKIMEFMSLGVPVVVANTKIDRYYFSDSVVRFFESGNADALADAVLALLRDEAGRRQMAARAQAYAAEQSWQRHQQDYLALVDSLCDRTVS